MAKAKKKNVRKDVVRVLDVFVHLFNNKARGELDTMTIKMDGKDTKYPVLSDQKLPLDKLPVSEQVANFFKAFSPLPKGVRFGFKNVYGGSFGLVSSAASSYKAVISHHKNNGVNALVWNQGAFFTLETITNALKANKVPCQPFATYAVTTLTPETLKAQIATAKGLFGKSADDK